jgi:hypothetical protein
LNHVNYGTEANAQVEVAKSQVPEQQSVISSQPLMPSIMQHLPLMQSNLVLPQHSSFVEQLSPFSKHCNIHTIAVSHRLETVNTFIFLTMDSTYRACSFGIVRGIRL